MFFDSSKHPRPRRSFGRAAMLRLGEEQMKSPAFERELILPGTKFFSGERQKQEQDRSIRSGDSSRRSRRLCQEQDWRLRFRFYGKRVLMQCRTQLVSAET